MFGLQGRNNHSSVERERERHSNSNELLQNKREKKERGLALLSLSTDSPMVFCLLRVHLKGPEGDWGIKSKDPEEPCVEELTGT